jgi:hypothetical protein
MDIASPLGESLFSNTVANGAQSQYEQLHQGSGSVLHFWRIMLLLTDLAT